MDPDDPDMPINLARYSKSKKASIGILTALDDKLADRACELLRMIPDEYRKSK